MALSKRDQEFYEEKLNFRYIGYLFLYTCLVGAIGVPAALYLQDTAMGGTSKWDSGVVIRLATIGFLVGSLVAVVMYLAFKFLLQMGWLPPQKR